MKVSQFYSAIRKVLSEKVYFLILLISAAGFLTIFILIPVWTIPGNSVQFQLAIFRGRDYVLMVSLALLVGLNLALQLYTFRRGRVQGEAPKSIVQSTVAGVSGVFGAVVGTAACASCLASLFGLIGLGTGSVFFVLKNQPYFLIGAIGLMLISLYFTAKRVNRVCSSC